ncbi:unnamed protein product [Porites evermanni]|uniref:Uncharacterized protein n=1 Tax=Porites evermanni TaxID=104178 RepID=A0ABN8LQD8_9CNID|nr:unnamed protein product [Porites evermanni]
MEDAPHDEVVDVAPTGQIKSKRLSACLEEVEKKKRTGESLLNEAKRMRLVSLTPSELDSTLRVRDAYMTWHEALFPQETVLPVSAEKLRALCQSLSDMEYS